MDPNRPVLTQLPNLKVVHFYDPNSGDSILTREDLVVIINSETKKSTFVQHADGTQMYSEITETHRSLEHVPSQAEVMLDQIAEIYPKNPSNRTPFLPSELLEGEEDKVEEGGDENKDTEKRGSLADQAKKGSMMDEKEQYIFDSGGPKTTIRPSVLLEPLPILPDVTTTWHIHKEGLAKVQGKVGTCLLFVVSKKTYMPLLSKFT